jgi:pectate lyase
MKPCPPAADPRALCARLRAWFIIAALALSSAASPAAAATRINVDFDKGSVYSGTAAAPDTGTVWNTFPAQSTASFTLSDILGSDGSATPCDVTVACSASTIKTWSETSLGTPTPSALMRDYVYGGTYTVTVSELPEGNYYLYVYAHGDQANQSSTVTISAANGGGSATTATTGTHYRNITTPGAEGYSYLKFQPVVGASGTLVFTAASYLNGFQLISYPAPVITLQPPPAPAAVIGSNFNLTVDATGDGTLTYRWRKDGANLADGPTGNGSTCSGTTGPTLTITNVRSPDAGNYDVIVTNPGGSTVSTTAALTTTTAAQAPEIVSGLANQTVSAAQAATFAVVVNGTSPLGYAWTKNGASVSNGTTPQGSLISGADTASLTIANATLDDAGSYGMTVTNPVGSAGSSATLTVNQAPAILTQPQSAIVNTGTPHTLAAVFGAAFPVPAYQWSKSTDGINFTAVAGANSPSLELTASAATSGFYRVTAVNSAGSVASSVVYFGIPGAQAVTFAPSNNSVGISIDQQLRLVFPAAPKLGLAGALRIHDASDNAVVATIDRSQFIGYTLFGGTIINAAKQTLQGKQVYYLPLAIYGNEVWITLGVAQRLSYGKTYYVTMDAGLLIDSDNAAFPGISSPATWRFSTKASGPAAPTASTGPVEITVGMDGSGDFATIQGASDWIPQNNALPRTIRVKSGVYRDTAYFAQGRDFVTLVGDGVGREDVQLIHLYAAEVYGDGARGMGALRIDSNDVTVRDITIDNATYVAQPNLAGAFAPPAPAFAGPINTVATTGKRLVFDNVLIKGGQDTLYTITGIAYFHRCEIWGSVDFIYGDALGVFDQCDIVQIRTSGGPVGAPSTPLAQPYGEVFLDCRFPRALVADGYPYDVGTGSTTFMRPWRQDGATAVINCEVGTHISPKGWSEWGAREVTCRAREFGTTTIGGGAATTPAQRRSAGAYWLNTLDPDYTGPPMEASDPLVAPSSGTGNRQSVTVDPAGYTLEAIFGHPYFELDGWMPEVAPVKFTDGYGSAATGGAGGSTVTAATSAELVAYANSNLPYIINVSGTIDVTGAAGSYGKRVDVKSNKTIQGVDGNATIIGNLNLSGADNIIIRKLNITHPGTTIDPATGKYADGGDGISIATATNVHVSHCTIYDCGDGCCDISHGADYVTVAWCKFYYTAAAVAHRFAMILGNTADSRYHTTLHHNWFAEGCDQRMPSGSYSTAHLYNNYFSCTGNSYCTNARVDARFRVENSYYDGVRNPCYKQQGGKMFLSGNLFAGCTGYAGGYDSTAGALTGNDAVFTPPYFYSPDATADVPALVMAGAGNTSPVLPATVTLGNLLQTSDGSPKPASVTTDPAGLAVTVTYDGASAVPDSPGSYSVVATVTATGYAGTASGTLVIEPPDNWAAWQLDRFTSAQIDAGMAGQGADPDGDGLANLAEYALGTDPHVFTPLPVPVRDGSGLTLTFTRPQGRGDIVYHAESTDNLGTWTELPLEVIQPGDPETVRVRDPLTSGDPGLRFIRLRFEMP